MSENRYKYLAFISYKREDEKWAKWLQHKLESYKLPTALRKKDPSLPKRIRPIFKDTTDLSGGNLERSIKDALQCSKYLIVICSPRAAQSTWVCKEVQAFIDSGREECIIPFIVDGEPNSKDITKECFPRNLRELSGSRELLGININEMGRVAAVIKVVARMFGVYFDELWQRSKKERKRKRVIMVIVLIILLVLSVIINQHLIMLKNNIYRQNVEINNKNIELSNKNEELEINNILQKLLLLEIEINSGNNIESFLQLIEIQNKYKHIVDKANLSTKITGLMQLCKNNIKTYPLDLIDIYLNKSKEQRETCIIKTDKCEVIMRIDIDYDYIIVNKLHNRDTTLCYITKPIITQDEKYLVFCEPATDGNGIIYFYDIEEDVFINKYESPEFFLYSYLHGGVIDVSYDNKYVLYHEYTKGHDFIYVIDLVNKKQLIDDIPMMFPKISFDKKYILNHKNGFFVIENYANKKEYCKINDKIFCKVEWINNNYIRAIKDNIVTTWKINNIPKISQIEKFSNISGVPFFAECSSDDRYLAVITDSYLYVWDTKSRVRICKRKHNVYCPTCLVFSKDSKKIAYVGIYGYAEVYDIQNNFIMEEVFLAEESSNAGSSYYVDFISNDEVLMTYTESDLVFCNSLYSLKERTFICSECDIYAINNDCIIFKNAVENEEQNSFMLYDYESQLLSMIDKNDINLFKIENPYIKHKPTWVKFDDRGGLYDRGDNPNIGIEKGYYNNSPMKVEFVEKYICDSSYIIQINDSDISISTLNLLDTIDREQTFNKQ